MIEVFLMKVIGMNYDDIDDLPLDTINGYMAIMDEQNAGHKKPAEKNQVEPKLDWSWTKR